MNTTTKNTIRTGVTWAERRLTDEDVSIIEHLGLTEAEVDMILADECDTTLARTFEPIMLGVDDE